MEHKELIALYFENKLTDLQKLEFEDLLKNNADFKAQFTFEKQVKKAIISSKKDSLRNHFKQIEQPEKSINPYYVMAIAASFLVLLGIISLFFQNEKVSNQELYAAHFKPYANIIAPAVRGDQSLDSISIAFRNYDSKNYEKASQKFKNLYQSTKASFYLFYRGVCELQLGNTSKAIELFENHKTYTDKLSEQNNWYLALAYLENNNTDKAKLLLEEIIQNNTYKHKVASTILKKIE